MMSSNMASTEDPKRTLWSFVILMTPLIASIIHVASAAGNITTRLNYEFPEDIAVGATIGDVKRDSGLSSAYTSSQLAQMTFDFRSPSLYLAIDSASGIVRCKSPIDRATICPYADLCQIASDVFVRPAQFFQVIRIVATILSANRHSPTFPLPSLQLNMSASTIPGTLWSLPAADDPDGGIHSVQAYQMIQVYPSPIGGNSAGSAFALAVVQLPDGSNDVRLRLMTSLDAKVTNRYNLTVLAVDGGSPPRTGSLSVYVTVTDGITFGPRFVNDSYDVTVDENVPISSVIVTVTATSQQPAADIRYSFDQSTAQQYRQVYALSNTSGNVYVIGSVDFEHQSENLLTVMAVDVAHPGTLPAYARVVVNIRNVNDNPPLITTSTLTASRLGEIANGAPVGTFVAYVGVSDPDATSGVASANSINCSVNSSLFTLSRIDIGDYQLLSAVVFGRGHEPFYRVTISCQDGGGSTLRLTANQSLDVVVIDSGPRFPQSILPSLNLATGSPRGTVIAVLNATGSDVGPEAAIQYSMSSLTLDDSALALTIGSSSGIVSTLADVPPALVNRTVRYVVTAVDSGTPPLSTNATLVIEIFEGSSQLPTAYPNSTTQHALTAAPAISDDVTTRAIIIGTVIAAVSVLVVSVVCLTILVCWRRREQRRKKTASKEEFIIPVSSVEVQRECPSPSSSSPVNYSSDRTWTRFDQSLPGDGNLAGYIELSEPSTSSDSLTSAVGVPSHLTSTNDHYSVLPSIPVAIRTIYGPVSEDIMVHLTTGERQFRNDHGTRRREGSMRSQTTPSSGRDIVLPEQNPRPPRPGFINVNHGGSHPRRTQSMLRSPVPPISPSSSTRATDPTESDSGCSGTFSIPDSGRGLSDEGEQSATSGSCQAINLSLPPASQLQLGTPWIRGVSTGSYSISKATQLSAELRNADRPPSFRRNSRIDSAGDNDDDLRSLSYQNSASPPTADRTQVENPTSSVKWLRQTNCDTYV